MRPVIAPKRQSRFLLVRLAFQVRQAIAVQDADAVHDLRVSIRRFQQALRVFSKAFPGKTARKIRRRLRRVMRASAEVRNRDIALEFLGGCARVTALAASISAERRQAAAALVERLREMQRKRFSSRWRESLGLARSAAPELAVAAPPAGVAASFFRTGNRVMEGDSSNDDLHALRLCAKRLRYTLEQFRPAFGPTLDRNLSQLRGLQQHLGEISDNATVAALLEDRVVPPAVLRRLAAGRKRALTALRKYWLQTFAASGDEERWLAYLSRPRARVAGRRTAPPAPANPATAAKRPLGNR